MAWVWPEPARRALLGDHTSIARMDIWHSGKTVYTLTPLDGGVSIEADAPIRRSTTASLVDPDGQLTRGDFKSLLNAYECEIAPYRGVRVGGVDYYAPLGVFGLTSKKAVDTPDGLTIQISGQDRAMGYQGSMPSGLTVSAGTPIEDAIRKLLSTRQSGLSILTYRTGFICGPLVFPSNTNVWAEATRLAESAGAKLYHDRTGQLVLVPAGTASDRPVARYAEGDGRLLDANRTEDTDTIKNVVIAKSADSRIVVRVEDNDPTSPTYVRGRYPTKVYELKSSYFGSVRQATAAATARLAYELGRSVTIDFTAAVDAGRDVDEVVTVDRPRAGINNSGVVAATMRIPFDVDGDMEVGCRQSRLAMDGKIVLEPKELAA